VLRRKKKKKKKKKQRGLKCVDSRKLDSKEA